MQENNFITKITGRGEIPINKMPGFHPPNNEEHEYILQRVEKNLKKEITTSVLWLIISLMISVFYLYMYITSNADNKKYMLIASAVFFIMAGISIYRLAVVDKMVDDIIITDELGGIQFRKPNDISFRIIQNRWRIPFEQIVYIGDNVNKDFQAPKQLGMRWRYFANNDGLYSNSCNASHGLDFIKTDIIERM